MDNQNLLTNRIFEAMGSNYDTVILVDLVGNKLEVYRKNPHMSQDFWDYVDTNPSYNELLAAYVRELVYYEDQSRMLELLDIESLKQIFRRQPAYSHTHRIKSKDRPIWYRIRVANLSEGEELTTFAVVSENIYEEMINEGNGSHNKSARILVIENNQPTIDRLTQILVPECKLILAETIDEGMNALEEKSDIISAIVLNIDMVRNDIQNFRNVARASRKMRSIPIIGLTYFDFEQSEINALSCGAVTCLLMPCNDQIIKQTVLNVASVRNAITSLNMLEKDPLTGLLTKDFFYKRAEEILASNPNVDYRFVVTDVENFKAINEKYGIETGDNVLRQIAIQLSKHLPNTVLSGRLAGDKFVYLLTCSEDDSIDRDTEMMKDAAKNAPISNLVLKNGVFYANKRRDLSAQSMCDRARLALASIKDIYGQYSAVYDDKFRNDMLIQRQILDDMEDALRNEEFQVYLQPKHDLHEDISSGAEALIRWNHPSLGFMNPNLFIPLFEQNGFIKTLDRYVFTHVCKTIKRWIEEGKKIVPISVNLSRRDFESDQLANKIIEITDSYGVPHNYIHLELTETAFADNPTTISESISKLHESGFIIELDDFGTGYSSLTTLNHINFDVLKLDMSLIQGDVPGSDRNILEFCTQLVKSMRLKSVAEGVETEEQLERLKGLGCDYVQGYFFSRPLTITDFEKYLENEESSKNGAGQSH